MALICSWKATTLALVIQLERFRLLPGGISVTQAKSVLILTPVKNASRHAARYSQLLGTLTYPADRISVGLLEGDSTDNTFQAFTDLLPALNRRFRRASLWKKTFGFSLPAAVSRHDPRIQHQRRIILAKARNHLLSHALDDEDWVLWLDVDVVEYPADIIEQLLAVKQRIVHPNCVQEYGGVSFDQNAWRDQGTLLMHDLRKEGPLVPLDAVGGTMLLIHADLHRDGLVFPPFPYGLGNPKIRKKNDWPGEIETEGLAMMAKDMGITCWGLPHLEILHAKN